MAINYFTEEGRSYTPKASIRKQGQIGLNQGTITRYNIRDGQFVLLGYDKDEELIAIRFVDDKQKGAKKVTVRNGNASIGAKNFLDYFGISYDETKSYNVEHKNDLLIFCL